jgi:acetyltransferase EpsM
VVADIVRLGDAFEIVGFLDDARPEPKGETFCDALILGSGEALQPIFDSGVKDIVVAIGNNAMRAKRAAQAMELGFRSATLVHPTASVAEGVPIGGGTVIKALAVVEPGATLGKNVILGAHSYVGHDVVVEDAAHISAGGRVAGGSVIAREAWIGIGATVKDGVRVGEGAQIGAGAVVLGDIPADVVATGNPAEPRWRSGLFGTGGQETP